MVQKIPYDEVVYGFQWRLLCFQEFRKMPEIDRVVRYGVNGRRFAAERFEEGFRVMRSGQSGKVILNWEELQ